jgi:hypothetical protein
MRSLYRAAVLILAIAPALASMFASPASASNKVTVQVTVETDHPVFFGIEEPPSGHSVGSLIVRAGSKSHVVVTASGAYIYLVARAVPRSGQNAPLHTLFTAHCFVTTHAVHLAYPRDFPSLTEPNCKGGSGLGVATP